ncbi:hypothetical protein [Shinella oryzae]|uniref:DUF3800 domain-containing protein n=1 Tax=Shinella oryzae TaxID=2871820 RepID=A0ABY9K8Y8_9HYPH|nr:hypothetical protein [Shinella oryzae]WLS05037.1 hypothetical protein Q9315_22965 [Shinella oryzae]
MDLSAYFDDSSSDTGERDLVFAGLVNSDEAWRQFAVAWRAALAKAPTITHLKMSEANALRGQFASWTRDARDQKLQILAEVLDRFRPRWTFDVSISRAQYASHVAPATARGLSTPHFAATFGAVSIVARCLASEGITAPVRFVFDVQEGVDKDVTLFFDYMVENLDPVSRKLINIPIGYGDEMQDLPLQAADMLAWHIRRQRQGDKDLTVTRRAKFLRSNRHIEARVPLDMLIRWSAIFSQVLPILQTLKSKGKWQRFRAIVDQAKSAGFRPPHGEDPSDTLTNIRAAWDEFENKGMR